MTDALQDLTLGKVMSCDGTLLRGGMTRLCCAVLAAALCRFKNAVPSVRHFESFLVFSRHGTLILRKGCGGAALSQCFYLSVKPKNRSISFQLRTVTVCMHGCSSTEKLRRCLRSGQRFQRKRLLYQAVPHFRPPLSNEAGSEAFVASAMGKPLILPLAS